MRGPFALLGALSGAIAVLTGAFGAHALRDRLEPKALDVWETAVFWQAIHALALLLVAVGTALAARDGAGTTPPRALRTAGWSFTAGTVLFSGSLYALAFTGVRGLGAVTPVGGAAFVVGWLALAVAARRPA